MMCIISSDVPGNSIDDTANILHSTVTCTRPWRRVGRQETDRDTFQSPEFMKNKLKFAAGSAIATRL